MNTQTTDGASAVAAAAIEAAIDLPDVRIDDWRRVFEMPQRERIEDALRRFLLSRRWFGGKSRTIRAVTIAECIPMDLSDAGEVTYVVLLEVQYDRCDAERYVCPLALAIAGEADRIERDLPHAVVAALRFADARQGTLHDATISSAFGARLLESMLKGRRFDGEHGSLAAASTDVLRRTDGIEHQPPQPRVNDVEQSNTSIQYGDALILKMYRKIDVGTNPDLEMGRFLLERGFDHTPPLAGDITYRRTGAEPITIAMLQRFVPNDGTGWTHALDVLQYQLNRFLVEPSNLTELATSIHRSPCDLVHENMAAAVEQFAGDYLPYAALLGRRTAELHRALSVDAADVAFAPEPIVPSYQRSLYRSVRHRMTDSLRMLSSSLGSLASDIGADAERLLKQRGAVVSLLGELVECRLSGLRIRCHGDYHLGQVLFTGDDYFIIDFEGEPARPLSDRKIKHSPLVDIAGILRSYDYASAQASSRLLESSELSSAERQAVSTAARAWSLWTSATFLRSYFEHAADTTFLPESFEQTKLLLNALVMDKAMYEIAYELNHRPGWVGVPIRGALELLSTMQSMHNKP